MPFTSPELVRRHLDTIRVGDLTVAGVPVTLAGSDQVQLPHRGLRDGSVNVVSPRDDQLISETITLTNEWVAVAHGGLVADSVLLAADDSLSTVYIENRDFIVDPLAGRIKRLATGNIPAGVSAVIFYQYHQVFTEGDDFMVDPAAGTISRRATGAIADGQAVTVGYAISSSTIADETIEHAIDEAGDAVLALIDDRHHEHPSPGIVIGETHLAVAVVCRIQASSVLFNDSFQAGHGRDIARMWLELAERYELSGRERLARFARPLQALRSPKIA